MDSGIYAIFGSERRDLITEATAQEFRNWMAIKGADISFISDNTLNGNFKGFKKPFLQWEMRLALIKAAENNGIEVKKDAGAWDAFVSRFTEGTKHYYGGDE